MLLNIILYKRIERVFDLDSPSEGLDVTIPSRLDWLDKSFRPEIGIGRLVGLPNNLSTNEDAPRQLPQVLNELETHVKAHLEAASSNTLYTYSQSDLDSVQRLISLLKDKRLFHCECKNKCLQPRLPSSDTPTDTRNNGTSRCPCKDSEVHHRGCTV